MSQVVLITGCSTGIGRDLTQRLAQAGYTVVATARKTETLDDLPAALKLPLDVTQQDSINQAVAQTIGHWGRMDVLVNNAGYALRGAVEQVSDEQAQQLFDVNVFGVMRMIRAVVPHMRRQRTGRIINLSSIAGRLSNPTNGTYSASKFALEALSDALRWELLPFGIQVVVIEPGPVKTHFADTAQFHTQGILGNPDSPYHTLYQQDKRVAAAMRQNELGPAVVSQAIQRVLEVAQPKARYLVGIPFSGKLVLHLGSSVWDFAVRQMYKID